MADFTTSQGRRPDLEAMEVGAPEGYIGSELVPTFPTTEKTGTVYFQSTSGDALAESAAETTRSASDAPGEQAVAASNDTWTCAEVIDRTYITKDEAKAIGTIAKADAICAKVAKRNVQNAIENAISAALIGSGVTPSATFDAGKFILQVQTALNDMRVYEGEKVLYGSSICIKGVVRSMLTNSTMGPVFARLIGGTSPSVASTGLNLKVLTDALAIFVGVDRVLVGRDANWNPSGYTGRIGLLNRDNSGDPLSHKWRAVYGKNFLYLPDGVQPYLIESFYDMTDLTNKYTCQAWYGLVEMNSACRYVFDGVETA